MIEIIKEMFSYAFILRAFAVGIMVSLCSSLLGVTLVLKKYSMIGDGLSHVGFGAMTVALALNTAPLYVAVPVMILAAFLLLQLRQNSRINSDAAIALISSTSIAVGITAASLSGGMNTDVYSYMFGSILAVTKSDVVISTLLCSAILLVFLLCYHRIFAVTFDESFAKAAGVKVERYNVVIAVLTAVTIVLGMRMMGAMLISSLIIFPPLTAMRLFRSFRGVVVCSGVLAVVCFCIGIVISYGFSTPAGASVVLVNLAAFLIFAAVKKIKEG